MTVTPVRLGPTPPSAEARQLAGELRRRAAEAGLAAVGFAPATPLDEARRALEERAAAGLSGGMQFTYRNPARSTDPGRILSGAKSLVVGAWQYVGGPGGLGERGRASEGRPRGRVARYATEDHYARLRAALDELGVLLRDHGWRAIVVSDDNALVDRAAAQRAGLGWFGKNSNILLPGRGSWFVLGSVVTNAPLPPSAPVTSACGVCRRCLASCPTGALVAPGVLDARRCLAWLLQAPGVFPWEYRVALGDRIYGCDDCQEVCPPNRARGGRATGDGEGSGAGRVAEGPGAHVGPWADLLDLLASSDDELMATFGRWYVPQRDPRYLRRNALVALGNAGRADDASVAETVGRYLAHTDELLRAHAAWAAFRLGRPDLVEKAGLPTADRSELVRAELGRGPDVPRRSRSRPAS